MCKCSKTFALVNNKPGVALNEKLWLLVNYQQTVGAEKAATFQTVTLAR